MIDPLDVSSLRSAREAAGLTRGELAAAAKISETTIVRIEKGQVDPKVEGTWLPLVNALTRTDANLAEQAA